MPTLHQLTSGTSTVEFSFGSLPVRVTYYPGRVTEEFMGQVLALQNMDEHTFVSTFKTFNAQLCTLIESWDITEDDERTMFPIEPDRVVKLPLQLRMRIAGEIMNDMRPNGEASRIQN